MQVRKYHGKLDCESVPSFRVLRIWDTPAIVRLGPIMIWVVFLLPWLSPQGAIAQTVKRRTRNPHGNLSMACENCHTAINWSPIRPHPDFNHNETRSPLRGMHEGVSCRLCHANLVFADVGMQCADCHADIHRRQFGGECEKCHTVRGWDITLQSIKGHQNRFPLMGAHAGVDCQSCHKAGAVGQFTGLSTACISCHVQDYYRAKIPNHVDSGFPATCDTCHGFDSWLTTKFDHSTTRFLLTGAHQSLQCEQCHKNGQIAGGLTTTCASCHLVDFINTKDPNHQTTGFPQDCSVCHTTADWQGATFNHNTATKFPLTGAHINVAPCAQCHKNNLFAGLPTACASCHLTNFNGATNPNHVAAGFAQDCRLCHTTAGWQGVTFNHNNTPFPLTGAHINVASCTQCHKNNLFAGLPTACVSCHLTNFSGTTNPNHVTAGFPQDCGRCHSTMDWLNTTPLNHNNTPFPLTGAHVNVACAQCHKNNVFAGLPTACVSCHLTNFNGTTNPNHVAAGFSQNCGACHASSTWQGATFSHNNTPFPLTGAHINVAPCAQCHKNNLFAGLPTACISCHLTDFNGTINPNHVSAGFPQECSLCHSTTNWQGAAFNHNITPFPLTGAHINVAPCTQCHKNNVFAGLPTACVSCHLTNFNGTTNPNHVSAGFPQDCNLCHSTTNWQGATFTHNNTPFPLTGAHINVSPCAQCHKNNVFAGLPTACISCHLTDFNGTANPNHVAAGFPQDCRTCHSTIGWTGATFNHNTATKFPLAGAHINASCAQCHKNNVFAGLSTACISCHLTDFNGTTNPSHTAAGFSQDCSLCHSTTNWQGATFNHNNTPFPLTGAHINVSPCAQCHKNNVFAGLSTACISCHLTDFNGTTNPSHPAAGFPQDCSPCHSTTKWQGATFNHNNTPFPLTGAHINVSPCAQCHKNNVFAGLSTACISCHLTDFNGTTNPSHPAAGFPQDCSLCHSTTNWQGATFNHNNTPFPLTGAHIKVASCAQCHKNNVFAGLSTACISCHLTDFNGTANPNHAAAGFPQDCRMCHATTGWAGATFNHNTATKFRLTGAHVSVLCTSCHIGNIFVGTPTDCLSCHAAVYKSTTNPNHVAAGFPTTCQTCHSTTSWSGATFNHTWFPTSHGRAAGVCSTCHTNSSNYSIFVCTSCHTQAQTNPHHSGERGYVYNSANCYQCHPRGNGG